MASNAESRAVSPNDIYPNPENPRLIFRERELLELEESIASNGILVPLTVFESSNGTLVLLDGERRWRCAKKLGLHRVPVIIQPQPSLMQNIMMMFAIHNARTDWDPFPTALKLRQLEDLYEANEGRAPTESQLAQLASLTRGEVRRLKNILKLPEAYLNLIAAEQDLPRTEQSLTVDHLLEVTRGCSALARRHIIQDSEQGELERVLIGKFKQKKLTSTVEPRLLTRMARAVERDDVSIDVVRRSIARLIEDPAYTIQAAFIDTVDLAERSHTIAMTSKRLNDILLDYIQSGSLTPEFVSVLSTLRDTLDQLLKKQ